MKTFLTDRNPVQEPWLDQIRAGDFTGMPHPFTWEGSFAFSHLIGNAYAHWRPLGLDPPQVLLKERLADAKRTGEWRGTAIQLWIALWYSHRQSGMDLDLPADEDRVFLDGLTAQLRNRLQVIEDGLLAVLMRLISQGW